MPERPRGMRNNFQTLSGAELMKHHSLDSNYSYT